MFSNRRRDFLKMAAASLGGALLSSGCSAGGGGSVLTPADSGFVPGRTFVGDAPAAPQTLPSYAFHRVASPNPSDPNLSQLQSLSGLTLCTDSLLVFHGTLAGGGNLCVASLNVDYSSGAPLIQGASFSRYLAVGDVFEGTMPDGTPYYVRADSIRHVALNNGFADDGNFPTFACVVTMKPQAGDPSSAMYGDTVLVSLDGGDFAALCRLTSPAPGGGTFGGKFGCLAVDNSDNLLMVAQYVVPAGTGAGRYLAHEQGLFLIPGAADASQGTLVMKTGDEAPGGTYAIGRFGLLDLDANGNFIVQTYPQQTSTTATGTVPMADAGVRAGQRAQAGPQRRKPVHAGLLGGHVGGLTEPRLLFGSREIVRVGAGALDAGSSLMGPRLTSSLPFTVLHDLSAGTQSAFYNSTRIFTNGDPSPAGNVTQAFGPATVDRTGLAHFLTVTDVGMELVVTNGSSHATILQDGDPINGSSSPILAIAHGFHSRQVDSAGRLFFVGEFEDQSQGLVVGIPIS